MRKKIIPIFFASDKNYVPYLTVAIKSLVDHASKNNIYKIYILSADLTDYDIPEIRSYISNNIMIDVVNVNEKIASIKDKVALRDYYSVSIYFRLFIPSLFPEFNKAIYLDSDVVLNRDIADLYSEFIGDNYLGAVLDEVIWSSEDFTFYARNSLGVTEKQYFNSGVLIMNLKKFRDNDIENHFYSWVNDQKLATVAPDQDYLNCVCHNKVKVLAPGWNKMPMSDLDESKLYLIHYNMFMKPWRYENVKFDKFFWETAKTTSLYNSLLQERANYPQEKKNQDTTAYNNLVKLAVNIAKAKLNEKQIVSSSLAKEEVLPVADLAPVPVKVRRHK